MYNTSNGLNSDGSIPSRSFCYDVIDLDSNRNMLPNISIAIEAIAEGGIASKLTKSYLLI